MPNGCSSFNLAGCPASYSKGYRVKDWHSLCSLRGVFKNNWMRVHVHVHVIGEISPLGKFCYPRLRLQNPVHPLQ